MTVLTIVVPCYNEEEALPETSRRLALLLDRLLAQASIAPGSGVFFVDDGSRDRTWAVVRGLHAARPDLFHGARLARNRGHQAALLAGLRTAPGDALVSIDADLQDDIEIVPEMLRLYTAGHDIVYAVRRARAHDTWFKRTTARQYYRLLRALGVEIVPDHADFRLMSRRAVEALGRYSEVNIFLRALVPLLGFRTAQVTYERSERIAGESKYPLRRMIGLALDGITSFSMRPLRLITVIGLSIAALSFLAGVWVLWVALFTTLGVPGWASILVPTMFIGGLQLFSLGVIGEYIGKIYLEVKRRPLFEIDERV